MENNDISDIYLDNDNLSIVINSEGLYIGEISKDKNNNIIKRGIGTLYYINGEVYKRQFENNHLKKGIKYYENGDKYEGEFDENNNRCGKGKLESIVEGKIYEGDWKNDKRNGYGKQIFPEDGEPSTYEGECENDEMNGKGKYNYMNIYEYEGNFKKGKKGGKMNVKFYKQDSNNIGNFEFKDSYKSQFNNNNSSDLIYNLKRIKYLPRNKDSHKVNEELLFQKELDKILEKNAINKERDNTVLTKDYLYLDDWFSIKTMGDLFNKLGITKEDFNKCKQLSKPLIVPISAFQHSATFVKNTSKEYDDIIKKTAEDYKNEKPYSDFFIYDRCKSTFI